MAAQLAADSVTVTFPDVTVSGDPFVASVKTYQITMDESQAPYIEAVLTIATPDQVVAEQIDPTSNLRVTIELTKVWTAPVRPDQTLTLDLYLHARTNTAASGETSITARSDEAILIDDMGLTVDHTYEDDTDLRTLVAAVLDEYGFTLESGSDTADITRTADATNLFDTATWNAFGSFAGSVEAAGPGGVLTTSWRVTATSDVAASSGGAYIPESVIGVTAGTVYKLSVWALASAASPWHLVVQPYSSTSGGTAVGSPFDSADVTLSTTVWRQLTFSLQVPDGAASLRIHIVNGASVASGAWAEFSGMLVTEATGISDTQYFDGSGSYPADSHYAYAWTGTANASASTRERLDNRSSDALTRQPGQKTWDFLSPMIQAAGLRLFCDETRVWRLVPNGYAVAGQVNLAQAQNLTAGADTIDLSAADAGGGPSYYVKVAIKYSWIDSTTGLPQEAYDTAGSGVGPGLYKEVNAPYPGPGAAASALARGQGRKRTLAISGLSELVARPGMSIAATLPIIPAQVGVLSAITWTDQDEMQVTMRGGIDTPSTAWILQPDGYAWDDVPTGESWDDYTTPEGT